MKAIRFYSYGPPEVLELKEIDVPAVGDDDVLIRVKAASVNPLDWHFMRGEPYMVRILAGLSRPKASAARLGADMAGSVEAVGKNVTELKPGEPGDMLETAADIGETTRDFGWKPKVKVEEGIPKFVEWFKAYNGL